MWSLYMYEKRRSAEARVRVDMGAEIRDHYCYLEEP
jgi:hypothetical protein